MPNYNLTTLQKAKAHLRLAASDTTYDTLLAQYIADATANIESVCERQFLARDYRLRLSTNREGRLRLPQWPVQTVTRIAYGFANAMTVSYTGSGIRASATIYRDPEDPDAGGLRLVSIGTTGVKTANNLAFATYGSVTALVTGITAISGWTASTVTNVPTGDLNPTGGENALGRAVTFTYPDRDIHTYRIDYVRGIVEFEYDTQGYWPDEPYPRRFPRGLEQVLCEFRAGYDAVPADLDLICRELVQDLYYAGNRDTSLTSETIGEYKYVLGGTPAERGKMIATRLSGYISERALMAAGN